LRGRGRAQDESPAERDAKLLALRTMEARATKLHVELESHKENNPEHFNQLSACTDPLPSP